MIRFLAQSGSATPEVDLNGSYLFGNEGMPIRAEVEFANGEVRCTKRSPGPAGLGIVWDVNPFGRLLLDTTRVTERDKPYILPIELARGRLMRISLKREDWGLYDYPGADDLYARVESARSTFVFALTAQDESSAIATGCRAMSEAAEVGEELSLFHANVFLERRRQTGQFVSRPFGCTVALEQTSELYRNRLHDAFDFVTIPMRWGQIETRQGAAEWDRIDPWINWARKQKLAIRGTPLISFSKQDLPDWVYLYEQDFDVVRDLLAAHIRRTVQRLGPYVHMWDVVSGIHANNTFNYTTEQLMELTRMSSTLVKQMSPRATTIIDMIAPWGEYYARNPRTVAPLVYADMIAHSGVPFDAFGLQFHFGSPRDGMYVRDMMQISAMIDRFANFGKPLHITALQVPSSCVNDEATRTAAAGTWHSAWDEHVQSDFVRSFLQVALSKPFVETVTWRDLCDTPGQALPTGGLIDREYRPKAAYTTWRDLRSDILNGRKGARR